MGLYLFKKLCNSLGLELQANSKGNQFTEVVIKVESMKFSKIEKNY